MDNGKMKDIKNKKIVCLGGGIGTVNLIRGLKNYTENITVIVSMADDGGSAGRLRRFYSVPPPGDLVSCIAAMSNADPLMTQLLTYRFSGNRYGSDRSLPGHKLGNLMLVALSSITGDFNKAVSEMQRIFKASGKILPSTVENVSIWAKTSVNENVYREENIDLGRFTGKIEKLYIKPGHPTVPKEAINAINDADVIVAGPGDLYTTILPVLLVPKITETIKKSNALKFFIINVANKLFETPGYKIEDYIDTITRHCDSKIFDYFFVNSNLNPKIPKKYRRQYEFVALDSYPPNPPYKIIEKDIVDEEFPIYHSSEKLAKVICEYI
ncbi:MAG: YvcK family protein [Patescibacteria group bacterium]|nr:YvcK family protein [Patescibacteria group bacterium]